MRLLEVCGVPGAGDTLHRCVRADLIAHALGDLAVLVIVGTNDEERGHLEFVETLPKRHLCADAGASQARGERCGAVAETFVAMRGLRRQSAEQGLCQPLVEELRYADYFDAIGECLVTMASLLALGMIFDAGRCTDEHKSLDQLRPIEGEP